MMSVLCSYRLEKLRRGPTGKLGVRVEYIVNCRSLSGQLLPVHTMSDCESSETEREVDVDVKPELQSDTIRQGKISVTSPRKKARRLVHYNEKWQAE